MSLILTINPGSTSTKIAIFRDSEKCCSANIAHDASVLAGFPHIADQFEYRNQAILKFLQENGYAPDSFDAVVGRGGGLLPVEGGVYKIGNTLLDHARNCKNGVEHPATLGPTLAKYFADRSGCPAFVVNPPDTDELQAVARITGIKGVYRNVHLHALNLKETAIHHSKLQGTNYEDCNYIVCHIGGGISISAHRRGKMIDGNDIVGGDGPMAPTRCGSVPVAEILKYARTSDNPKQVKSLCTKTGGFVSLLGTSDAREVSSRAEKGDRFAKLVWETMIYQIEKEIGAMSAVLKGRVDAILLSGGMVHNQDLVAAITGDCQYIAPVYAYPGEFEMEAMANGALRVLRGEEEAKVYTGKPVWDPQNLESGGKPDEEFGYRVPVESVRHSYGSA